MKEYLELGPVPFEEESAQMGKPDFVNMNKIECIAYKHQLERLFPTAEFRVKVFPYDNSEYYREVCVDFDSDDEQAADRAYSIESLLPATWDTQAIEELKAADYSIS